MVEASVANSERDRRIAELEAKLAEALKTIERLRERYRHALEKLALAERRIVSGKAERKVDDNADQLAFEGAFAELKVLESELAAATSAASGLTSPASTDPTGDPSPSAPSAPASTPKKPDGRKSPSKPPKGRRDLSKSALPVVDVEVLDPELEGKAERVGFEVINRLGYRRGGKVRIAVRVAQYRRPDAAPTPTCRHRASPFAVRRSPSRAPPAAPSVKGKQPSTWCRVAPRATVATTARRATTRARDRDASRSRR